MLTRVIIAVCLAVALLGGAYGLWQAREVSRLGQLVQEQAEALRGAEARTKASASAAKARKKINHEQEIARAKDQDAVSRNPEWASQPIPADIAERLLND